MIPKKCCGCNYRDAREKCHIKSPLGRYINNAFKVPSWCPLPAELSQQPVSEDLLLSNEEQFNLGFKTPYKSMSNELHIYSRGIEDGAKAQLAKCQPVIDKLRTEIKELKDGSLTYCVYCGMEFLIDDEAGKKVTEHIKTCEKHPLHQANKRINELEATLKSGKLE